MPRIKAENLPLKERKKYFVTLFVRAAGAEDQIADCERKASLKPGTGKKLLQDKAVKAEVHAKLEPIRQEKIRQQTLTEAADKAYLAHQQSLAAAVDKLDTIDPAVLNRHLMMGVLALDWNIWPKEKLDVIKAAYVVAGTLQSNSVSRVIPADNPNTDAPGAGIYQPLFAKLRAGTPSELPSQNGSESQDEVFDLIPQPKPAPAPPIPVVPEPLQAEHQPTTITVEVE